MHRYITKSNKVSAVVFFASLALGILNCLASEGPAESLQFEIAPNSVVSDEWKLSWNSETDCVYFVEQSSDHSNWSYVSYHLAENADLVEELFATTEDRLFFRIRYTEFTSDNASTLLTGDFDGDLISNYDEINAYSQLGLDPLDADSDGNGTDDGAEDADADGNNNAYEFTNGRLVLTPDADVALYTDVLLGDDINYSGISAVPNRPAIGDGPKVTIASAIATAADGDIILMQPGTYDETAFVLTGTGKNLTIRPNGPVTIQ